MRKLVKSEVIGSANPIASFFRGLSASIKGIATGILLIIVSFVLVYYAANQTKHSEIMKALPLQSPDEVQSVNGMVKIHGVPSYSAYVKAPNTDKKVLYYTMTTEEYAIREITVTETETVDGKTVENTYVEYKPEWQTVSTETDWGTFKIGQVEISNTKSSKLENTTTEFYKNTEDLEFNKYLSDEDLVDVPQKRRITVTGVNFDDELIITGEISNNTIASGGETNTYFISNKSEAQMQTDQASDEQRSFWIMIGVAWFLMTTGFTMLLGPITKILDIIPGVGGLVNGLLFIIFGIISAILILLAYIGFALWWAIALGLIGAGGYFIYKKINKKEDMKRGAVDEKKDEKVKTEKEDK